MLAPILFQFAHRHQSQLFFSSYSVVLQIEILFREFPKSYLNIN
jgi:hypothetical protein